MINVRRQVAISTIVVGCCLGQSLGAVIQVPGDYATIQGCIDASTNGDVCSVSAGTYNEAINFLGKAITVRSLSGADATTIDATGLGASVVSFETGEDTNSRLLGFTITGGVGTVSSGARFGGGVYISGASPAIADCVITANTAVGGIGGGIFSVGTINALGTTGRSTLTNCTISNNSASEAGGMLAFGGCPTLVGCAFIDNDAVGSGGGFTNNNAAAILTDCTFSGNTASIGGAFSSRKDSGVALDATLTGCAFNNNTAFLWGGGMSNSSTNPTVTDCTFTGNTAHWGGGMDNSAGSNPIVTDCTFTGNSATGGVSSSSGHSEGGQSGAGGGMNNFDASSPTLLRCSFVGNMATNNSGTAFVAGTEGGGMSNGRGSNPTVTDSFFSGNTAKNRGGGMDNYDNSSPIVTNTIFRDNSAQYGGAMYNRRYDSNPTITGCTFEDNVAFIDDFNFGGKGGGINNDFSSPIVTDCTFSGNIAFRSGGAMQNEDSAPVVSNSTFLENAAPGGDGGAMLNFSSNPAITNCAFSRNSADFGGAMSSRNLVASPGPLLGPDVTNSTFSGNSAASGGAMHYFDSPATVMNCSFVGNSATSLAGAMYIDNSGVPSSVTNCTFVENQGSEQFSPFAAVLNRGVGTLTVANSILWGNSVQEIGGANVSFSIIDGGLPADNVDGGGNIDFDPQFVLDPSDGGDGWGDDPNTPGVDEGANDDFGILRLLEGSPGIDAGDNMAVPLDVADLDGDMDLAERTPVDLGGAPRFIDDVDTLDTGVSDPPTYVAVIDMGAFEHFIDCNQNGIVDETEPDCDSALWPANGIPDYCDVAQCAGDFGCGDCTLNGIPDGCDIGAGEPDDNSNGVPDVCEAVPPALMALASPIDKDRVISLIVPENNPSVATALRVSLTSLHNVTGFVPIDTPDFSAMEGELRFVNLICDGNGEPITQCLDSAASTTYYACATLGCVPEYADWAGLFGGLPLHISGSAIVPDSVYGVSQLPAFCAGDEAACATASAEFACATLRWGDANGSFTVDVTDIVVTVDRVKDALDSVPEYMCYVRKQLLQPQTDAPNVTDVVLHADAVKSAAYPFAIATCP